MRYEYGTEGKMKRALRITLFLIVLSVVFLFCSCGERSPESLLKEFFSDIADADAESAVSCLSDDSTVEGYVSSVSSADNICRDVLKKVYSAVRFKIIDDAGSDPEVVVNDSEKKEISVELTYPDLLKLMSDCKSRAAVMPASNVELVEKIISEGKLDSYTTGAETVITVIKEDDVWKIPLSKNENGKLYDALMLTLFAKWLVG